MENEEVMDVSEVDALAEGGFADIIGAVDVRLHTLEGQTAALAGLAGDTWITGALVASDAAAGVFSWQNTTGNEVELVRALVLVKTIATGACTVDVGEAATAISANNLLTGLDVHTAAGLFDNITEKGASGKSRVRVPNNAFVTASMASGATAGLVGRYALQIINVG